MTEKKQKKRTYDCQAGKQRCGASYRKTAGGGKGHRVNTVADQVTFPSQQDGSKRSG